MRKKLPTKSESKHTSVRRNKEDITVSKFYHDIRHLIEEAHRSVAITVNAGMTMLYWQIGNRISDEILKGKRAEYGEEIVSTLWRQLSWSHFKEIIYIEQSMKREFYAEICRVER